MDRGWYFRAAMVLGVLGLAVYLLYPSYYYYFEASAEQRDDHEAFCAALPSWSQCMKFNLGLDLQGGVHLVMGVLVDRAVEQRSDRLAEALRDDIDTEKLAVSDVRRPKSTSEIQLVLRDGLTEVQEDALTAHLRREYPILEVLGRRDGAMVLGLVEDEAKYVRETALEQAIKTIRNRADKLGVTEPTIAKRGEDSILIQLPGVKDPARAIDIIGRTAQLEFKIVDAEATKVFEDIPEADWPAGARRRVATQNGPTGPVREVYFEAPESARQALAGLLDGALASLPNASEREIAFGPVGPAVEGEARIRSYLVHARPGITGDYLTNAQVQQNPELPSDYYVTMTFDAKGAKVFEELTAANVQRQMAIVLDGTINSAPVIQEKIPGGTARITLGGAGDSRKRFQEAKDLALVLKAGALPAPVEIREKRQVGKTLGRDSVSKGSLAIIVGAALVVLFMLLYYRGSGLVANVALVLNVVLVLAVLALFGATLTLPGMAGIVLTIGMAVDANVIIFERIKEELRAGKVPRVAIEAGYGKAFSTIFDANVTTLIAGVVLMQYGSGPVRGFAVTLIVGILCSMFTAIVVTRIIYDYFTGRRRLRALSI